MKPDIERYLNKEMAADEQKAFEQRMSADPDLQLLVKQEEIFLARLKTQMLREKINDALADSVDDAALEKLPQEH
jgi:anti-sigma-K factor RskA